MSNRSNDNNIDTLARAIPGQSLTDEPGKNPYEKPALTTSPEEALEVLTNSIEEPDSKASIIDLLDAGISAETIGSSLVLKMFSEGVFSPDVAELVKPPLIARLTVIASEAGVEDVKVMNSVPQKPISSSDKFSLMEKLNPEKHSRKMNQSTADVEEEEMLNNIDFSDMGELPDETEESESFMNMEDA